SYIIYNTVYFTLLFFFFQLYFQHRDLHSFPTRRSSDLAFAYLYACDQYGKGNKSPRKRTNRHISLGWGLISTFVVGEKTKNSLRSEEHTSELQSPCNLVCRLLLEKKKKEDKNILKEYIK